MLHKDSILNDLDNAFQSIAMPCFGNMNIDYVSSRLSTYRSTDQWLLLFNSVVWCPAGDGLMAMVEPVGTGVIGRQGFDHDRFFAPACIEFNNDEENILSITIRGQTIEPTGLAIQPNYDIQPEYGFWVSVALAEKNKENLLASQAEVQQFIPAGFHHLLTIDEWDHPTWNTPPSQTVTFPLIADVLVASDPSLWNAVESPNTHWSHWLPK
ncbi:MAG: hypothetical protein HC919_10470 [Oscillatoriales cyanobacterium SM2_2_1]|nr:hypothetical protein [Oscillatoriales cyanobacterium SM2_2_1]